MPTISEHDKQKIIGLIKVIIPEAKIILFGSFARGTQQVSSDIDLALDAGRILSTRELGEVLGVLDGTNLIYKIDVVDLQGISEDMRKEISREGILWST